MGGKNNRITIACEHDCSIAVHDEGEEIEYNPPDIHPFGGSWLETCCFIHSLAHSHLLRAESYPLRGDAWTIIFYFIFC